MHSPTCWQDKADISHIRVNNNLDVSDVLPVLVSCMRSMWWAELCSSSSLTPNLYLFLGNLSCTDKQRKCFFLSKIVSPHPFPSDFVSHNELCFWLFDTKNLTLLDPKRLNSRICDCLASNTLSKKVNKVSLFLTK